MNRKLGRVAPAINKSYNEHVKRLKTREARGGNIFVESSSHLENVALRLKELLNLSQTYAKIK